MDGTVTRTYEEFLASKALEAKECGFEVDISTFNPAGFDWQNAITRWLVKRGRAALFAKTGLGKGLMQMEWCRQVSVKCDGAPVLIVAPPAVAQQFVREGDKFGFDVNLCKTGKDIKGGINVTNYQKLHKFDSFDGPGIDLDEASILKHLDGHYRNYLIARFKNTPYRLAATATPAPNDHTELGNTAEFLGIMSGNEMLSTFFRKKGNETHSWVLMRHGEAAFWRWVASWAAVLTHPRDLGYEDNRFDLPPLRIIQHTVPSEVPEGMLFAVEARTLRERQGARRASIEARVAKAAELVAAEPDEPWILWAGLNAEAEALNKAIPGSVEIGGKDDEDEKEEAIVGFLNRKFNVLISKDSVFGFGLNLQLCARQSFVGLGDSWERYHQCIKRSHRYEQDREVVIHVVTSEAEGEIVKNIARKQDDNDRMTAELVKHTKDLVSLNVRGATRDHVTYTEAVASGEGWRAYLGDAVNVYRGLESESIGLHIFSPPFAQLYAYSASDRDMGNTKGTEEFLDHFGYLVPELYRTLKPGRICAVHCMNLPAFKFKDGYIGYKDFRGDIIRLFESHGFIPGTETVIRKDPVVAAARTHAKNLGYGEMCKDSTSSGPVSNEFILAFFRPDPVLDHPDYIIQFRKPGENAEPVSHTKEDFPLDTWRRWADVWDDIDPSDTLQFRSARDNDDIKHLCPLQLEISRRCIILWSNPGDVVSSPFGGIGSELYMALGGKTKAGLATNGARKGVTSELKESYFRALVNNLNSVVREKDQQVGLWDGVDETESSPSTEVDDVAGFVNESREYINDLAGQYEPDVPVFALNEQALLETLDEDVDPSQFVDDDGEVESLFG